MGMIFGMSLLGNMNTFAAQFIYPLKKDSFSITNKYGNYGYTGTDFGVPLLTPVFSTCSGTVKEVDPDCGGSPLGS